MKKVLLVLQIAVMLFMMVAFTACNSSKKIQCNIGDTINISELDITINSWEFEESYDGNNKYCYIYATVYNPTDKRIALNKSIIDPFFFYSISL